MDNIKIDNLNAIYDGGLKSFTDDFLKEKVAKGQGAVYSIEGKIVKLSNDDVRWLYDTLTKGLEDWEVEYLEEVATSGGNMEYYLDTQTIVIPAADILELFERLKHLD